MDDERRLDLGTGWHNVPGLGITRCTVREVSETATLTVSGGPVRFRSVTDGVPEAPMKPGVVRFVPNGKESVTYTFVANTAPFEADDDHRFDLQWQSPTGARITLHNGGREPRLPGGHAELLVARTRSGPAFKAGPLPAQTLPLVAEEEVLLLHPLCLLGGELDKHTRGHPSNP